MMNINSEPFEPTANSLRFIEEWSEKIVAKNAQDHNWFLSYAKKHKKRIAFDLDFIQKQSLINSTIVEVGSVPLLLTLALKQKKYQVLGIDISPERFIKTIDRFNLDVRKCDIELENLPLPDNFCDFVIFNEIFEHLRINLIFTIRELLRIIKPGGRLYLTTPNVRSLRGIKNILFKNKCFSTSGDLYRQYERLEMIGHMGHVREYTSSEVVDFLEKLGFTPEEIIYRGDFKSKTDNMIVRLWPSLRPYFTVMARKPV